MTLNDAVDTISGRLGQRAGLEERIIAEMKFAQAVQEGRAFLPWFLQEIALVQTVVADPLLAFPTGFLREQDEECGLFLTQDDGSLLPLLKAEYTALLRMETLKGSGPPKAYALYGGGYRIFPVPDAVYDLEALYYKADSFPASGADTNKWLTEGASLLIAATGVGVAKFLRSVESVQLFMQEYLEALSEMRRAHVARDMAARELVMGG